MKTVGAIAAAQIALMPLAGVQQHISKLWHCQWLQAALLSEATPFHICIQTQICLVCLVLSAEGSPVLDVQAPPWLTLSRWRQSATQPQSSPTSPSPWPTRCLLLQAISGCCTLYHTHCDRILTHLILQPHACHLAHRALPCCCQTDLLAALQAKSAAVPNPIDALSANAKSVTQDAKATVNGAGVPDPVRFVAPRSQLRCTYRS